MYWTVFRNHVKIPTCHCEFHSVLEAVRADADKLVKRNRFSRFLHSSGDARAITDMKDRIAAARRAFEVCSRFASCSSAHWVAVEWYRWRMAL